MIDKGNMLNSIESFPRWILQGYDLASAKTAEKPVSRVVAAGMGGSGISGLLLKSLLSSERLPVDVALSEELPKGIGKETLVFTVSYSGETPETLQAYRNAQRRLCQIAAISSGGKLARMAQSDEKMLIQVPDGLPPRASLPFLFFPMLRVLQNTGLIKDQRDAVMNTVKILQNPEYKERGEDIASELKGKITLIYSTPFLAPAAYRWKCQINENSKAPAFCNVVPELMHNEVEAFQNINANFHILMLREESVGGIVSRGFGAVKKILREKCPVTEMVFKERDLLGQLFSAAYIGDWASYFLAIKYDTDPTPNPIIDEIKKFTR